MSLKYFFVSLIIFSIYFSAQANSELDSIRNVISISEDDSVKIRASMYLARQIHRLEPDDPEDFYFANLAVELSESHNDTLLLAESLDNLGLLYRYHSQYAKSIPLHIRAVSLVREMNVDPYFKMRFANNAGVSARYDQAYDLAVEYYLFALKIAEGNNDLRNIAIASNGLGNSLSYIDGKSEEALVYYMKALETEEERENTLGMAMNYLSIASYYSRKEEYSTAREYLDELLIINTERKDQHGIAMTYEYYGHSYLEEGKNLRLSEDYYQKALQVFQELNQEHKEASMLISLGQVNTRLGRTSKSLNYLRQAYQMAQDLNNKALIMESARLISETYEGNGNYAQALAYYKTAEAYKDSLSLMDQEATIEGLRLEYDFEKKEAELNLLQADKELQEQQFLVAEEKFKREKTLLFGVLLAFLAISLVITLSLRNINLKKNLAIQREEQKRKDVEAAYQNDLLQAEILATRMQMNPHFLFNCLNSIKLLIQKEKNKKAVKYLTDLSRFVRDILQTSKLPTVSLEEELELTKKYIKLEESRFEEKLQFELCLENIEEKELKNSKIPPMLLQPFVENSIWHGLLPSQSEDKKLRIAVSQRDNGIFISIMDNGIGRQTKAQTQLNGHKSMGVTITQQRIDLFNKITNQRMQMDTLDHFDQNKKPSGTEVQIHLNES